MRSAHSPSLRSRYDYYYSSPTATTTPQSTNYYENQHASLFGDPVPPSTGFIENLDNHLYGSLRRFDIKKSSSSHILDDFSSNSSYNLGNRYYSAPLRDNHPAPTTLSVNSDLYNVNSNSSFSNNNNNNFIEERGGPPNMITGGDPMMYSNFRRSNSSLSNDFRMSLENYRNQNSFSPSSMNRRKAKRIFSSDSSTTNTTFPGYYNLRRRNSSNDWMSYKNDLQNWSNIPRPQHKSKNISQVNHGSSSSDETTKTIAGNVPGVGAGKSIVNKYSVLPYTKTASVNDSLDDDYCDSDTKEVQPLKKSRSTVINVADDDDFEQEGIRIKPKQQSIISPKENTSTSDEDREIVVSPSRKVEPSPVILTDKITTGSNHRLLPPGRQHKKPSFTIINELSPNQSRAPSPTPSNSGRTSPFLGRGFKPPYYNYRNSLDSIDQVGNRPAVHFGKTLIGSQPRSRSSMSLTPRSILNTKNSKKESYENQTDKLRASTLKPRSTSLSRTNTNLSAQALGRARLRRANSYTTTSYGPQRKSFEMLPFEKSQIPRLSSRNKQTQTQPSLLRGKTLILDEKLETTNSKPPVNPRSHHKGVMKVVNNETGGSPSKIPKRNGKDASTTGTTDGKGKATVKKTGAIKKTTTPQTEEKKIKADGEADETEEEEQKDDGKGKAGAKGKVVATKSGKKQLARTNSNLSNKSTASKVSISKKLGPSAKESAVKAASALSKFSKIAKNKLMSSKPDAEKKSEIELKEKLEKEKVEKEKKEKKEKEEKEAAAKMAMSPSRIPVRQPSNPKIEIRKESPIKIIAPPEPKSPTKSMLSVSIKKSFGLSSVSKALTRSFRRKKKEGSESGDTDSLASVSTMGLLKRTDSSSTIQTNPTKQESGKSSAKDLKKDSQSTSSLLGRDSAGSQKPKKEPSILKKQISNLSRKITDIETAKKIEQSRTETDEVITEPIMKTHREVDEENLASNGATKSTRSKEASDTESYKKLVPLTKTNVVSMTTAAITAQPVQISTTVTNQLGQVKESGYEDNYSANDPASLILEKSQRTLEDVQKTVKAATTEIQNSINENLTNLKSLEQEVNKNLMIPPDNHQTSGGTSGGSVGGYMLETIQESSPKSSLSEQSMIQSIPQQPISKTTTLLNISRPNTTQSNNPVEASVSVVNEKLSRGTTPNSLPRMGDDAENNRLRPPGYNNNNNNNNDDNNNNNNNKSDKKSILITRKSDSTMKIDDLDAHGNSDVFVEGEQAQFVYDDDLDSNLDESTSQLSDTSSNGCCGNRKCCKCCRKICMPCKKICRVPKCCRRKTSNSRSNNNNNNNNSENSMGEKKNCCGSCLRKLYCCGRSKEKEKERKMKSSSRPPPTSSSNDEHPSGGKCSKCLEKMFCCRATNKIEASNTYRMRKCCFCIPCGKKILPNDQDAQIAWANRRESINNEIDHRSCCSRFLSKMNCCKKKSGADAESRRTSKNSKAQSIAPTLPPEDNRPKLDLVLVEHTSKMKAAIPVLPICLAWFCAICNFVIPGLGTIFSGILCLCIGIPRFSQHDNAKGRIGSFIINLIVGVSQAFCLLFCLVGYGWSAWWGVIMIRTARKHRRIKEAESHEPSPVPNRATLAQVVAQNHRDVEAGR